MNTIYNFRRHLLFIACFLAVVKYSPEILFKVCNTHTVKACEFKVHTVKYTGYSRGNFKRAMCTAAHLYRMYKIDFILTCRKPRCVVINRCRRSLYQRAYFMTVTVKIINIEIINFQFIN